VEISAEGGRLYCGRSKSGDRLGRNDDSVYMYYQYTQA